MREEAAGELRSVANALRVLERLAEAERPLAVTELAAALGIAPSTAHRILGTLAARGFAIRAPANRRYRSGPALTRLARRSIEEQGRLRDAARSTLERLAAVSGETSHLAVLDGDEALGVDHVQSAQPVSVHHPIGSRIPAHATAVGQAILAHLPEVARRMAGAPLPRHTRRTITDPAAFRAAMAGIRDRGYAINIGQLHLETAGVAAPIFDDAGVVVASVGISGPAARLGDAARLERLAAMAVDGAHEIGTRLSAADGAGAAPSSRDVGYWRIHTRRPPVSRESASPHSIAQRARF